MAQGIADGADGSMASGVHKQWYDRMGLRIALGVAGLAFCSLGVGILIGLDAASGAEPGSPLRRLLEPLPPAQMAWWAAGSVLLGFAVLTNATHWLRRRAVAYMQAAFFLATGAGAVGLWISTLVSLGGGVGRPSTAVSEGAIAAVCVLCLLRAVGMAWRWADAHARAPQSQAE